MRQWPGRPYPLGATWDGAGVNFALFSEHATGVELCLFDGADTSVARERIALRERTDLVWHGYLPAQGPGQLYGYRVHGPYEPERGLRFNPAKLLIDPYAGALAGELYCSDEVFGYRVGDPAGDLSRDDRDSSAFVPKGVVIDPTFDGEGDQLLRIPWHRSIVYELHVKGFTARHPDVPEPLRGTYAGLATPAALDYLSSLGITAVELLPVHHHVDEHALVQRGLRNYWGYNSIGFFALETRYAAAGSLDVRMPGLDGPGLYRALGQTHPRLLSRFVFLTGDTLNPESREFVQRTGAACLNKPFDVDEVHRVVGRALASR